MTECWCGHQCGHPKNHEANLQEGGMVIDGLYIPPIGFFGIRNFGELVWGPRVEDKLGYLRCRGENWDARRALIEHLYYRRKTNG